MPVFPDADAGEASVRLVAEHQALWLPEEVMRMNTHDNDMGRPKRKSNGRLAT